MDFIFASATKNSVARRKVISYDIACQYSRNFYARFAALPMFLCIPALVGLYWLVPKFHLPAHIERCRFRFSFNYTKGVAQTDGEAVERIWSSHNHLSGSTMRMTPLARIDTLNQNFNHWNWVKICDVGTSIHASTYS